MSHYSSSVVPIRQFINTIFTGLDLQREISQSHVLELRDFYVERENRRRLPQYCPVFVANYHGSRYLIDGQHRYSALTQLEDILSDDDMIEVREFTCATKDEVALHFKNINSTHPLPPYFITDDMEHSIKDGFKQFLRANYKWYIRTTDKPQAPYFNPEKVVEKIDMEIVESWFANNNIPITVDAFIERFREGNQRCKTFLQRNNNEDIRVAMKRINDNPIDICIGFPINWFSVMFMNAEPMLFKRTPIHSSTKNNLWRRHKIYFNAVKCCCCDKIMELTADGEVGHIVSVFNGGTNSVDNLIPICGDCNRSCSYKNLDQYMREIGRDINNYRVR